MRLGILFLLLSVTLGLRPLETTKTAPARPNAAERSPAERSPARPNIVFILTDDQRWSALGYAGNPLAHTPEMDKLARTGTYFKKGMVTTPICAASRASILSGMYERTHRYTFQTGPMREKYMKTAYPNVLKKAGYYTGFYGKLGVKYDKADQFFDVIEDYDRNNKYPDQRGYFYKTLGKDTVHLTRYTGQKGIDFIKAASAKKPFCLSLSFSAPHAHDSAPGQYFYDQQTAHLLDNVTVPPPALGDDKYFAAQPEAVRKGFNRLRWTWRFDTPEKYQRMVKGYYRMIAGVDLEIARIRAQLKQQGLDKNTIIIVMGDNGYFLGERQLADKWLLYDNSVRVPLIIYDPRTPVHRDVDDMALNIDVPATIADAAGVKPPAAWHGRSLLPIVSGTASRIDRDTVLIEHLWEFKDIPPSEGVRTKQWTYFRYVNDKTLEELYDLQADPQQTTNLAKVVSYSAVLNKLRGTTDRLSQTFSDPEAGVPSGLMTNFGRQPGQVLPANQTPEFSWIVPTDAVAQSAYEVLVASSETNLNNNIGDVWSSGQVRGSQSTVPYAGPALKPGMACFWKVRLWDTDNRTGDYSATQSFRVGQPGGSLAPPASFQIERNAPQSFRRNADGSFFADFGKDAFATLALTYSAAKADTLLVRLGEQLDGDRINRKPAGHIRYQEVRLAVQPGQRLYQLAIKPDQPERRTDNTKPGAVVLPDSFPVLLPFRYAEIERAGTLTADALTRVAYFGQFDDSQSSFTSSDTILNQVWDLCKYSIKETSFAGLYIDGDRERIPYEADAYLNQLSHYATDREYGMARRTIAYFMQHPTWPTEWQLHVALMMHQDYMATGNTDLIARYYAPLVHKTLIELVRDDGLISSQSPKNTPAFMQKLGFTDPSVKLKDIVDWPPAQKDTDWKLATAEGERDGYVFTPVNTVVNALFVKNMEIMAEFAHILNKPTDEARFQLAALKAKQAINEKLFNDKTGTYVDGEGTDHSSLHANMMVLAFDVVPDSRKKSVAEFIKSRGMACSVYGSQYLLESLYNAGEADYALQLMTAQTDRSWYNMIRAGSTVTWEAWDTKYKPNLDWNHAWGATPANVIPRNMWGIQPAVPGGSIVSIRPQLGTLTTSSIKVPMLKGAVSASYVRKSKLNQEYIIDLPANVSAELALQSSPEDTIVVDGERADPAFATIRLSPGRHVVELIVNTF